MNRFKLGVLAESFRLPIGNAISLAAELGLDGVQVYAVDGEITPEKLNAAKREEFRKFVANKGLGISALCGDLGGHGFRDPAENPQKVARTKAIVDLAADLGTHVVTTHVGVIPDDETTDAYQALLAACRELGPYAESKAVTLAIETGPETAATLSAFLEAVGSPGIGVNLDPANFVMVTAEDPVKAVELLAPHIVHTHAKDGIQHQPCDPFTVYEAFATGGFAALEKQMGQLFSEVPLGQGNVDWDAYLAALEKTGFSGFLTIEREVGGTPEQDIRQAVEFLRSKI